jgi:hypothetical protein
MKYLPFSRRVDRLEIKKKLFGKSFIILTLLII